MHFLFVLEMIIFMHQDIAIFGAQILKFFIFRR